MSKETVELTLEVPKGVIDFLTDLFKFGGIQETPKEFLERETVGTVKSILGEFPTSWVDEKELLKRYGLDKE
jgi:hypothetical protein